MMLLAVAWLGLVPVAGDDDGFGGASASPTPPASPAPSGECMVRTDDGQWISCADAIARKDAEREAGAALRELERAPVDAGVPAATPAPEPAPPPRHVTELEQGLVKAGMDPKLPVLALRIRVAELEHELSRLEQRGFGGTRRAEIESELARERLVASDVEYLALGRMLACTRKYGMEIKLKRVEMTPAGPVYLNLAQLMAQLPKADPYPCGRIFLVEQADIDKVRHAHALYLAVQSRNTFRYGQRKEREAAEAELATLEKWFFDEGIPPMRNRLED